MSLIHDLKRFQQILEGRIKDNLQSFISRIDLVGKRGDETITMPHAQIELPSFMFDTEDPSEDTAAQFDHEQPDEKASLHPTDHTRDLDVSLDHLFEMINESLGLFRIEDKGKKRIQTDTILLKGIKRSGLSSNLSFRRTYKEALKRTVAEGNYDFKNPTIECINQDFRFRSYTKTKKESCQAVMIYMMDVSGSMGEEQKKVVRLTSFWLDQYLEREYPGIEKEFIIHDAKARLVDQQTFFSTKESGGTLISSAYDRAINLIEEKYPTQDWNIYFFHFSDGDNWSLQDTEKCYSLLDQTLLPSCNLFCYGQVESRYGSGQFLNDLKGRYGTDHPKIVLSDIKNVDGIMSSLKDFLGR